MHSKALFQIALSAFLSLFCISVFAGERHALVVGNSNYQFTSSLANPQNDADLMARTLEQAGFQVTRIIDANLHDFKEAMLNFGRKLRGENIDAGLFYYAGHGIQVNGVNYLVPTSANIQNEDEVDLETLEINDFLRVMNSSNSKVNIVILDACRNNPFARSFRSINGNGGLAPVQAPKGTYIAYATAPGQVASDGDGKNSPYTLALAKAMQNPGVPIERVFKSARVDVLAQTNEQQVPWEVSSITGEFYFKNDQQASTPQPAAPIAPPPKAPEKPVQKLASLPKEKSIHAPAPDVRECSRDLVNVGAGHATICVSSILSSQSGNSYRALNMFDDNPKTAWVEGAKGTGFNQQILIKFEEPTTIRKIEIMNGYNKSKSVFTKNSSVRKFDIKTSNNRLFTLRINDKMGWQRISLGYDPTITWMLLTIKDTYAGTKYEDTAISEFRLQ